MDPGGRITKEKMNCRGSRRGSFFLRFCRFFQNPAGFEAAPQGLWLPKGPPPGGSLFRFTCFGLGPAKRERRTPGEGSPLKRSAGTFDSPFLRFCAEKGLGARPQTPPPFEKGGRKLLFYDFAVGHKKIAFVLNACDFCKLFQFCPRKSFFTEFGIEFLRTHIHLAGYFRLFHMRPHIDDSYLLGKRHKIYLQLLKYTLIIAGYSRNIKLTFINIIFIYKNILTF